MHFSQSRALMIVFATVMMLSAAVSNCVTVETSMNSPNSQKWPLRQQQSQSPLCFTTSHAGNVVCPPAKVAIIPQVNPAHPLRQCQLNSHQKPECHLESNTFSEDTAAPSPP